MSKVKAQKSRSLISERNRITLAYLELIKDKVFQKLPEEKKLELVKEVLAIGDEAAARVLAEYKTNDPRKIASKIGIKIFGEEKGGLFRSEYRHKRKEIVISRKFHEKLLQQVQSKELSEHLLKLVVAHELFHHLEAEKMGEVYKRYKFKIFQLGPLVIEKTIKSLSEVAAQAFTHTLLGLEVSPPVFDYLVLTSFF